MASLSTSTSDDFAGSSPDWPHLRRRLGLFLAPFILLAVLGTPLLLRTGELLPASAVAWLQTQGVPFLYLPRFTDHTFAFKVEAVRLMRPDVVAIGSSRSNQWRSAMFRPISFYNAGGPFYAVSDFIAALEAWDKHPPRVMILTLDYFMFIKEFQSVAAASSKNDMLSAGELALATKGILSLALSEPDKLFPNQHEPIYGLPALGMQAISSGTGIRMDGSFQYGHVILNYPQASLGSAVAGITEGGRWPLQAGSEMMPSLIQEFERFTQMARQRNIALIAVTPPFSPAILRALQQSPYHEAFRQFQSPQTAQWLKRLGVTYFDFADLRSIGGRAEEFVDPYHPSEPAYVRMLLTMMDNPSFAAPFPSLDQDDLRASLAQASRLEVYRNKFPQPSKGAP